MPLHARLPVDARHFDRWLALFEETARAQLAPDDAARVIDRATRIASSLELGRACARGALLAPGRRFHDPLLGPVAP
jgi:hemoglobin